MYSASQQQQRPPPSSMNGMMDDGTGTINPAALNAGVLPGPASMNASNASPRGVKRSRSPEGHNDSQANDDEARRKRGRPPKSRLSGGENELPAGHGAQQPVQGSPGQGQPPHGQVQQMPPQQNAVAAAAPVQASPKPAPAKSVVKALPTVRDHTTDQLTPEGDEYIPREFDESGEKKVSPVGRPLGGREYKCRTFLVPNRGDKLFMLATECARVLGYRDSYLLFNKNRSLFKIIATQAEKDDLIGQEILPYSYRSRQIAIVTAKSMFRQFGSRVIQNGRRVRDDYWEAKARKQGFTEEDLAGEKRPGGQKAREAQAAEQAAHAAALGHNQDVVYSSSGPGHVPMDAHGHPQIMQAGMQGQMGGQSLALPMISLAPADDMRLREYSNVPRPRQELTGQPYQDRSQPSSVNEIVNHAQHATDYSKVLNQQRQQRGKQMDEYWKQPRENPQGSEQNTAATTTMAQMPSGAAVMASAPQPLPSHQGSQMIQGYQLHQNPSQSPASRNMHQASYPYGQGQQMWGQPPPNPAGSPMGSHHNLPQYAGQQQHPSQSPHASQSPHQNHPQAPPPLHHGQPGQPGIHAGMGYMPQGYMQGRYMQGQQAQAGQSQHASSQHGYMQQSSGAVGGSIQGWAPPPGQQGHGGQQGWGGNY